jgi:alanine-glyoxylate transaminase/serine-glyoxylate transaminase/serine-pyruvate transaminase
MTSPSPLDLQGSDPVLLLGPGPAAVSDRVLRSLSQPVLGYLDKDFFAVLAEEAALLRTVFGTKNPLTFALSGTGMSGMECVLANLLEPGEKLLVCVNGFFGERMAAVAARHGIDVCRVEAEWGSPVDPAAAAEAAERHRPRAVAAVHAETSTGCLQPLAPFAKIAKDAGALFVADCVTSLGGVKVDLDAVGVDAAYAGSQKCLGAPPGLSPVSFSARALERVKSRKSPVSSWYHDLSLLAAYYPAPGAAPTPPAYHHTPSPTLHYGLLEALRALVETEGLDAAFARHALNHRALVAGLEALGLTMAVAGGSRTPMLNSVRVPDGIDDVKLRAELRDKHRIEIGAGLGKLRGQVIRIGLMGHSSRSGNVLRALAALASSLGSQGFRCSAGAAVDAALAVYR